jgi:GMP synthase-like glutamine amidotransferase
MRVAIFRHVPFEGAGLIEPVLCARGIAFDYVDLYRGDAAPDPGGCHGLIFLGGPMSVNDDLAYLRLEEQLIREAVWRGVPVLGICLGAQLIARALGATVRRNPAKEIGWFDVDFAPEADSDPLFGGLSRETVFHWHGETFDLPDGARLLASSELCRNQAFRMGDDYGIQFHLEVMPEMIAEWCVQDENCGDVRELTEPIDTGYNAVRLASLSDRVFGAWCDLQLRTR